MTLIRELSDEESSLPIRPGNTNAFLVRVESRSSSISRSSLSLSGDTNSSASRQSLSNYSVPGPDDTDSSTGPDSDFSTKNNKVALRPLYSAARQIEPEDDVRRVTGIKLSQRSRKGHRKSRQGCFNCKRRKIKCQETLPACENCLRKELQCRYPLVKAPSLLEACYSDSASPLATIQLQTTPIFSLVDMRLLHHFILNAYPHLPVGNDAVWVRHIPAVAHHHEYLMHALLGLAASHLTVTREAEYGSLAQSHRFLAIKGFNEALCKTPRNGGDGDALLAACYALTFQSSYMKDAMSEFLTMVRGCGLVSSQLRQENVQVTFTIDPNSHLKFMESRLENLPSIDADLFEGATDSFEALAPLCVDVEPHMLFHRALYECAQVANVNPRGGYYKFICSYQVLGKMTHQQFQIFLNDSNDVTQLLLAHFVALEVMLAPILGREWNGRIHSTPMESILEWLVHIHDEILSPYFRNYMNWPLAVAGRIKAEVCGELPQRPWVKECFSKRKKAGMMV